MGFSWIMEGRAAYSAVRFGDETGWGPNFVDLMMAMKAYGGNTSPEGIAVCNPAEPLLGLCSELLELSFHYGEEEWGNQR